jgi:WD40 repeat protein
MMASLATTGRVTTATVQDLRSGRPLATFPTVSALDLALDGRHRRVVVTPLPGGGSDAVVYSLDGASRPRPMDVDEKPGFGEVMVGFDGADERLAISSSTGVGLYDAATLLPVAGASGLPTGTLPGPFLFLDPDHVLTGTTRAGPLSVWSVRGTSALVTHEFPQFNKGVYPEIGGDGSRLVGISLSPSARSITMLDARFRPLTGPIAVEPNLQAQPADVRNALNTVGPVMCADPAARRLAIVSLTPPDLTIRNAAPPFQVLSHTAGAGRELGYPDTCVWSHDGHQIAIGTAPFSPTATPGVGLFDVRTHTMRRVDLPPAEVVSGLAYSPDSRTLWASGFNHVYRITDLDRRPRVGAAFPGGSGVVSTRDGSRLIVTTSSSVRVYDGRTLAPVTKSIPLGSSFLYQTNGSADGRTAVANSSDGWRLVDLKAEQPIGPWVPGPFPSLSIISADGNALYTVATSGEGQIWDVSRANLRAAACGMAGRNLTRAEWDRFLPRGGAYRATCAGYPTS